MATGLKVRLDDGSEVGPLELQMVRSWYEQGLINPESAVQRAGSKQWQKLAQAVDLRAWGNLAVSPKKAVRSKSKAAQSSRGRQEVVEEYSGSGGFSFGEHWTTSLAGIVLLVAAAVAAYLNFHAEDAVSPLDRAPWWPIALGLLASALALLPGWEFSRKLVRFASVLAAIAVFPLLGILVAQGVRGAALLTVGGVLLLLMALFAFLADPSPHWLSGALRLLAVVAGAGAVGYFGYSPETTAQREVRDAVTTERRFSDSSIGVRLELPPGFYILKKDAGVFEAPGDARALFAHPRQQVFGYFTAVTSPEGVTTLDNWLDRIISEQKKSHAGLTEEPRTEVAIGNLAGRRASALWTSSGVPYREMATVWRDGWIYYALVAWAPESAGAGDLEALATGVGTSGTLAASLQQAIQKVTLEVPALTPTAAEMLMQKSEAKVLEPDQAFRRSFEAVANALPTWKSGEAQEMGRLIAACYSVLSNRDRVRLAAYVEKVQKHQLTTPDEDRDMGQLMKAAVLRLPAPKRARLQALYQKAVEAAVS
jgi:hypothetical protein